MTKYVRFLTIMLFSFVSVLSLAPTPAHAQYQNNYQPVYRVETYGAVKNQSGVDNSGAFNRAIAAASSAGGGIVEVDSGTYWAQGSIVLKQNVWLRGKSASTSIIKLANDKIASLDNFTKSGAQGNKQYAFIRTDHANAATTTFSNTTWTNASKTITATGIGNAVYLNQQLTMVSGVGVTPGATTTVVTITGPNTITVFDDVNGGGAGNAADITFTVPLGLPGVHISDLKIDCNSATQTGPGTGDFASGTAGHPFGATPTLNGGFSGLAIYKCNGALIENVEIVDALPLQEVGANANLCCWALSILDSRLTIVNGGRYYGAGYDAIGIRGDGTYFPGATGTRLSHVWAGKAQRGAIQQAYGVADSTIADCIFDNSEGVTTAGGGYFHGSVRLHVSNTVFRGSNDASTTSPCGLHVFGDNSYAAVDNVFTSCSAELPVGASNGYALSIRSYKVNGVVFSNGIVKNASETSAAVYCAAWDTSQAAGSSNYVTIAGNVITSSSSSISPVQFIGHNGTSTPAKWLNFSDNQVYATSFAGDTRAGVAYGSVSAIVAIDYAQNFQCNRNRIFGNQSDVVSLDTVMGFRACTDFNASDNFLYSGAVSSDGSAGTPTGTTWALSGCTRGVIARNTLSAYHKGYFFYCSDSSTNLDIHDNIITARTPPFSVCNAQRAIGVTAGIFRIHDNDFSNLDPTSGSTAQSWGAGFTAPGTLSAGSVVRNNIARYTKPGGGAIAAQRTENSGTGTIATGAVTATITHDLLPWRTILAADLELTPTDNPQTTGYLGASITNGTYVSGTKVLTSSGSFGNVGPGTIFYLVSGTASTPGAYIVLSRTANTATFGTELGSTDASGNWTGKFVTPLPPPCITGTSSTTFTPTIAWPPSATFNFTWSARVNEN